MMSVENLLLRKSVPCKVFVVVGLCACVFFLGFFSSSFFRKGNKDLKTKCFQHLYGS